MSPGRRHTSNRLARLSIRGRLLLVAVVGVAAALAVGGVLLYVVLTQSLARSVANTARASAEQVAILVDAGRVPDPVPVSAAQVVQVLDASGRVVSGSLTADRLTPLVTDDERARALAGEQVLVPGNRTGLSGQLLVAAIAAGPQQDGTRAYTVVAAAPTTDIEQSASTVRWLLLAIFPLLLAVLAVIAWRVIDAALAPVEQLRRGAERIDESSADDERLPVPPTNDEVSALATTLNAMLDRIAAARRRQRAFVADAAHELRSPLASMRTQLEVADHLGDGGALPAQVLPDVERLAALVDDLLLLARADDGATRGRQDGGPGGPGDPSGPGGAHAADAIDVLDVLDLITRVGSRYADARVPVRVAAPLAGRAGLTARADAGDATRALLNLVDNAVRHARTAVVLDAVAVGHRVEVTVTDVGHGVPPADRERVFERFTRLDEARDRDSGGSGLGLPITRALVRRWGGDVRIEDAAPGVRAVISLPAGQ